MRRALTIGVLSSSYCAMDVRYALTAMNWLDRFFRKKPQGTMIVTTARNPYVVRAPAIAFLNLAGADAYPLLAEDRAAFSGHFAKCVVTEEAVPVCDVIVLYCQIDHTGKIRGCDLTLNQIARASRAVVVVVAFENSIESYIAAGHKVGEGSANVVMTLERNGDAFPHFFDQLFAKMAAGITMPMAWVDLAPQTPGMAQDDVPGTICAMEAGHIIFAIA